MKSGICYICGLTNVGKSTLLNKIVGFKATIVSDKPDTTRTKIMAVYNEENFQVALIDSPGINKRKDFLAEKLNKISFSSISGNDLIFYVVDKKYSQSDKKLIDELKKEDVPIFLLINKIDNYKKSQIDEIILSFKDKINFKEYIPISSKTGQNIDKLLQITKTYLDFEGLLFPKDFFITLSKKERIEEIVREKIFYHTQVEIPYSSKVMIEHTEKKDDKEILYVSIILEKESQKKIILGNNATILSKIKKSALKDIRKYFNKNYVLDLFIKVKKDWRNNLKEVENINLGE